MAIGSLMADAHQMVPSIGERHYAYTSAEQLPASVNLGVGDLTVDVSRLALTSDQTVDLHVGTGQLNLVLGQDVATEVTWTIRTGKYSEAGFPQVVKRDGFDLSGREFYPARTGSAPTLHIHASVDLGEVQVQR
jgi:predicted membrane protein